MRLVNETLGLGTQRSARSHGTHHADCFGERQHLLRVLDSLEGSHLSSARRNHERRVLEELIHARTKELNETNSSWDEKVGMVLSAEASSDQLDKLAKQAPKSDFYLLRLISEHPRVSSKTLGRLARHSYAAIRENVARHPNAEPATLAMLSRDRTQPLWYLVAFIPTLPGCCAAGCRTVCGSLANAPEPSRKLLQ